MEGIFKACFGFSVQVRHMWINSLFFMEPKCSSPCSQELYLSLSWATPIQWMPSHLCQGLASSLFPSNFPTKILYAPLLTPMCHMPFPCYSLFVHPSNIWWGVLIIKLLNYQFSTVYCRFLPCGPRYLPEHSSQTPLICVLPSVGGTMFHTHIKQGSKLFSIF